MEPLKWGNLRNLAVEPQRQWGNGKKFLGYAAGPASEARFVCTPPLGAGFVNLIQCITRCDWLSLRRRSGSGTTL